MPTRESQEMQIPEDVRFLLTVLLLFIFYPVGLVLMWVWTTWPKWVKWLVTLPLILGIIGIFFSLVMFAIALHSGTMMHWQARPMMRNYYYYRTYPQPMMQTQPASPSVTSTY